MNDWPNSAEARLLDALEPPPMRDGFGARVAARLPETSTFDARRDRRGGWRRGRAVLLGSIAAGLLSVGAAASGVLGTRIQNLPVIATIADVAHTTPAAPPKAKLAAAKRPVKPPEGSADSVRAPALAAEQADLASVEDSAAAAQAKIAEFRRERRAERLADRMAVRAARRAELGLPVATPEQQQRWREQFLARSERMRAAHLAAPEDRLTLREARQARRRAFIESLTPEQRAELRARQEVRRERRAMMRRDDRESVPPMRRELDAQPLGQGAVMAEPER